MASKKETAQLSTANGSMPEHLPSLDGWRAVSILLVLIQHSSAMPGWPQALKFSLIFALGGVGVRFFFVISGFLITWLLIKERSKYGSVSIKSFYLRRCIRILPVFVMYLIAVALLQHFSTLTVPAKDYVVTGTFMGDLWNIAEPFAHLWSLGVEEKFYLFWPVLFIVFFQKSFNKLTIILIVLILIGPILRGLVDAYQLDKQFDIFNYHSFIMIYDGLAIGCMGAILLNKYQIIILAASKKSNFINSVIFISGALLAVLPLLFWIVPALKGLQSLQDTLQCSGFLILMIQSIVNPGFFIYRLLNLKLVKHIGVISYSLYIWMGIAELPAGRYEKTIHFFNKFPWWLIVAVLLAELSYNLVELPILKTKKSVLAWFGLSR